MCSIVDVILITLFGFAQRGFQNTLSAFAEFVLVCVYICHKFPVERSKLGCGRSGSLCLHSTITFCRERLKAISRLRSCIYQRRGCIRRTPFRPEHGPEPKAVLAEFVSSCVFGERSCRLFPRRPGPYRLLRGVPDRNRPTERSVQRRHRSVPVQNFGPYRRRRFADARSTDLSRWRTTARFRLSSTGRASVRKLN